MDSRSNDPLSLCFESLESLESPGPSPLFSGQSVLRHPLSLGHRLQVSVGRARPVPSISSAIDTPCSSNTASASPHLDSASVLPIDVGSLDLMKGIGGNHPLLSDDSDDARPANTIDSILSDYAPVNHMLAPSIPNHFSFQESVLPKSVCDILSRIKSGENILNIPSTPNNISRQHPKLTGISKHGGPSKRPQKSTVMPLQKQLPQKSILPKAAPISPLYTQPQSMSTQTSDISSVYNVQWSCYSISDPICINLNDKETLCSSLCQFLQHDWSRKTSSPGLTRQQVNSHTELELFDVRISDCDKLGFSVYIDSKQSDSCLHAKLVHFTDWSSSIEDEVARVCKLVLMEGSPELQQCLLHWLMFEFNTEIFPVFLSANELFGALEIIALGLAGSPSMCVTLVLDNGTVHELSTSTFNSHLLQIPAQPPNIFCNSINTANFLPECHLLRSLKTPFVLISTSLVGAASVEFHESTSVKLLWVLLSYLSSL